MILKKLVNDYTFAILQISFWYHSQSFTMLISNGTANIVKNLHLHSGGC